MALLLDLPCLWHKETHHEQVHHSWANPGRLVQQRLHIRRWPLAGLGKGATELAPRAESVVWEDGIWFPSSPRGQTQSTQCGFHWFLVALTCIDYLFFSCCWLLVLLFFHSVLVFSPAQDQLQKLCATFEACVAMFKAKYPETFTLKELPALEKGFLGCNDVTDGLLIKNCLKTICHCLNTKVHGQACRCWVVDDDWQDCTACRPLPNRNLSGPHLQTREGGSWQLTIMVANHIHGIPWPGARRAHQGRWPETWMQWTWTCQFWFCCVSIQLVIYCLCLLCAWGLLRWWPQLLFSSWSASCKQTSMTWQPSWTLPSGGQTNRPEHWLNQW